MLKPSVPSMSPRELEQKLAAGATLALLDVREDDERAHCAIGVSENVTDLHVPMGQIPQRVEELRDLNQHLIVYCHHGVRSMAVAKWLLAQQVEHVWNLDGGIDAWSLVVDPKVRRY